MPIYEYKCNSCGKKFTELILPGMEEKEPICPNCGSRDVKRLISSVGSLSTSDIGSSCTPSG